MIKIFRQIRQNLFSEGLADYISRESKTTRYLKYAIGEIILVVIGILIALQINTWYENYKNAQKEKIYLLNLQEDLSADLSRLEELKNDFETAVKSKKFLEKVVENKSRSMDSLSIHYSRIEDFISDFVPNSTTLDELKNSNGLNVISNQVLRRQIVTLYNTYDDLLIKIKLGTEKSQRLILYAGKYVKNLNNPSNIEVSSLLDNNDFINQLRFNYSYTQLVFTTKAYNLCVETLDLVKKELAR